MGQSREEVKAAELTTCWALLGRGALDGATIAWELAYLLCTRSRHAAVEIDSGASRLLDWFALSPRLSRMVLLPNCALHHTHCS